nr:protein YLS9-like [Ipomoea batatas]
MGDRVHPRDSPPASLPVSSNNSGEAVGQPAKPQCPAPAKPVPPPGTYVVQVPKDQIYRYPPPENARRFNALSKRKPRRSCCCQSPKYTVSSIAIKGLNLTSPSPISPEFDVTIRAENPNDKIGIYYRKGSSVTVFHSDVKLCEGALPTFYQPSNNVTVFPTALKGSNVALGSAVKSVLANQQRQGGVPFRLNIKAPVKIKIGAVKTWKITVKVKCDVTVDALTEKSNVISKDCKYSARPWYGRSSRLRLPDPGHNLPRDGEPLASWNFGARQTSSQKTPRSCLTYQGKQPYSYGSDHTPLPSPPKPRLSVVVGCLDRYWHRFASPLNEDASRPFLWFSLAEVNVLLKGYGAESHGNSAFPPTSSLICDMQGR